jgi:hypothetical protein
VPPVKSDDNDKTWPAPSQTDFGLKVDLVAPAAKKDAAGVVRLSAGSSMTLHLTAEKDCRVVVWWIDPDGGVMRLFPNEHDQNDRLTAGKERTVPGNDAYTLDLNPTEGTGAERLRILATTGEPPSFPPGAKNGRFTVYAGEERDRLIATLRGVVIKKKTSPAPAGLVSEAEIRFRVSK